MSGPEGSGAGCPAGVDLPSASPVNCSQDGGGLAAPLLSKLEQAVATMAEGRTHASKNASQMLDDYAKHAVGKDDWTFFVQHNWLPVLSAVLGPDWRDRHDSELAAMIALQTMVQPPSPRDAARPAAPAAHADSALAGHPLRPSAGKPHVSLPRASPLLPPAPSSVEAEDMFSARAFTTEAVDVDGKRRRLRRKRAASPEEYEDALRIETSRDGATGLPGSPPPLPAAPAAKPAAVATAGGGDGDGFRDSQPVKGATLVQRVMKQVSRLSLGSNPASPAPIPPAAADSGGAVQQMPPAAAGVAAGQLEKKPPGGDGASKGGGAAPAAAVQVDLQEGLAGSLMMIHDLAHRLSKGLHIASRVVDSGGQSPKGGGHRKGGTAPPSQAEGGDGAAAVASRGQAAAGALLSLIGSATVDRCDLLGRTALHVAAAGGQADIVRQLVGSGCDVNKRLPMDYRTVLVHGLGAAMEEAPGLHRSLAELSEASAVAAASDLTSRKKARYSTGRLVPQPLATSLQYCTAVHLAAGAGDISTLEALLSSPGVDLSARSIEGATPLHFAAQGGHVAAAARFCRAPGQDIDAADGRGRTALHYAAALGHAAVVVHLWAKGACIDPEDDDGWRPLHYAAREGHTEVAASLVIAGSQVQATDNGLVTAAHLAAERGFVEILDKLLMAGHIADAAASSDTGQEDGPTALHLAAQQGHAQAVAVLLRWAANPRILDARGLSALDCAVSGCHFLLVPALLEPGCCMRQMLPDSSGGWVQEVVPERVRQALHCLASDDPLSHPAFKSLGPADTVFSSLSGAPWSFFACAAASGNLRLVQALAAKNGGCKAAAMAPDSALAALLAVRGGHAGVVKWLFTEGGLLPETFSDGALSPLQHAAVLGHAEVLRELLQAGFNPCDTAAMTRSPGPVASWEVALSSGRGKSSALQDAVHYGHLAAASEIIAALSRRLEGGALRAALDHADNVGFTPLHLAAAEGQTPLIEELLQHGASVDPGLVNGQTPLHLAAKGGHARAMHALLRAGASPTAATAAGWTALHYVAERGDLASFALLYARTAPALTPPSTATLLTAAVGGSSAEMVGMLLASGAASPQACAAAQQNPVHVAAGKGFVEVLNFLRGAGFDLASLDADGKSPLHCVPSGFIQAKGAAARHEDFVAAAEVLLECGCTVDQADAQGCTPLHIAAGAGSPDLLRRFMELAPTCDAPDEDGWTPLFWAASEGHVFAVDDLLEAGSSPFAEDCHRRLALHFAAENGHASCVRRLVTAMRRLRPHGGPTAERLKELESGAAGSSGDGESESDFDDRGCEPGSIDQPDESGQSAVELAAEAQEVDCVAALLDPGGAAEGKRRSALHLAVQQGLDGIVKHLLASKRLNPYAKDADGWTALHHAAAAGDEEIAGQLLAAGCDADDAAVDGDTALHKAALGGHLEVTNALLRARCQVDSRNAAGSTPLYNAASQGHVEIMQALREAGAAPDAPTANGCTALYIAANNGWADACTFLLGEMEADPDAETTGGNTALHAAAQNGHLAAVQALLAAGADTDASATGNGAAPLHNAAAHGHAEVAAALLAAGADIDAENSSGNTPLHVCAGKGWAQVVNRLLEHGADLGLKNHKGYTAIQSAANGGFFEIVLKLAQAGAAWRHKGDGDVVKTLSRKTTLKVSYIEGRLRLVEKVRHRRTSKGAAAGGAGPSIGTGLDAAAASDGAPPQVERSGEDLEKAAAQADAVMAALLQEESVAKEKEERAKAKKAAKKQKKAAQKQAEADAEAEAAAAAQEEARSSDEAQAAARASAEAAAAAEAAKVAAVDVAAAVKKRSSSSGTATGTEADGAASAKVKQPSPRAAAAGKAGKGSKLPPHANGTGPSAAPRAGKAQGQPGQQHSAAAARAQPQVQAHRTPSDSLASAPAMRVAAPPAAPKPAPPPPPPAQPRPSPPQTPAGARPSGPYAAALAGPQPPPPKPVPPPLPLPGANATPGLGARQTPWGAATQMPARDHQQQLAGRPAQQVQQHFAPARHVAAAHPTAQQRMAAAAAHHLPLAQAGFTVQLPLRPPQASQPGMAAPQQMQRPAQPQPPPQPQQGGQQIPGQAFVPLFGLALPPLPGISAKIDWSMPGGAPLSSYGSPAAHPHGSALHSGQPPPPGSLHQPSVAPAPAGAGGSFSPSDSSSIESSEATDLLNGIHGRVSRELASAAGRPTRPHASLVATPPKPMPPPAAADADGIDDVLRLQPWLQE